MTQPSSESVLRELWRVVEGRKQEKPAGSYVAALMEAGHEAISAKIIEEAYELIHAAGEDPPDRMAITHEAADLLFHLLVLLSANDVNFEHVERELTNRFGK